MSPLVVEELLTAGDTDADGRLSRKELGALAEKDDATARTFIEGQDRILGEKGGVGLDESHVSPVLTFGQICEMVMMVLLPLVLAKFGFRITMALGIAAWGVRDLIFALSPPAPVVLGSVALHGVGFAFFFTAIFMFADAVAPKDIKSSAQSFLASVTIGCGMLVGSLLAGPISSTYGGNWHKVFLVPAILCGVCCVLMLAFFREKQSASDGAGAQA